MSRIRTGAIMAAGLVSLAAISQANAATVYTDRAAFEAAVSGALTTDTFDNEIVTDTSITFDSGVVSTKSTPGVPPTLNRVRFGDYDGFVQRDGFRDITWDFPAAVSAFGADFSDIGANIGSLMVSADFDGTGVDTYDIGDLIGGDAGFFGIIGDVSFSSIVYTTLAGTILTPGSAPFGGETFSVDNLAFAGDAAVVPLPAALPLLLTGFGALGFASRKRKTATA